MVTLVNILTPEFQVKMAETDEAVIIEMLFARKPHNRLAAVHFWPGQG
jgi:hypothetical protein